MHLETLASFTWPYKILKVSRCVPYLVAAIAAWSLEILQLDAIGLMVLQNQHFIIKFVFAPKSWAGRRAICCIMCHHLKREVSTGNDFLESSARPTRPPNILKTKHWTKPKRPHMCKIWGMGLSSCQSMTWHSSLWHVIGVCMCMLCAR